MTKLLMQKPSPARPLFARFLPALVGGLALFALTPSSASAQDDPRLRDALRIAQEGGSDSARIVVNRLLQSTPPTDSIYPEIVYTLGLVSRSVEDMRRNYTRVAVEFGYSAWADDALFRLGLLDYAAGNPGGTVSQMNKIRSDYPDSPMMAPAAEWAARALFDQKRARDACDWLAAALPRTGEDVELRNRLEFLNGRCSSAQLAADSARSAKPDTAPKPPPANAPRTGFGVQIGAVNTQSAADKLVANLKNAGFNSYVVKDGALIKVRTGPFPDRAKAQSVAAQVRTKLGGAPFVVKEP